jgi:F-type H+-transporting ATPase subunit b
MLEINSSVFIQIINFLLLLLILNIILFRPIRQIIKRRKEETLALENGIGDYQGRAREAEEGVEVGRVEARKEGFSTKEGLKEEGLQQEKGILQEAGAAVEAKLDAAKKDMEAKMADVRKALDEQIDGFSGELAEKILGRSIQ